MNSAPMERVLISFELFSLVLANLDKSSQARCARVCKAWSEVAIQGLWRSIEQIDTLFQLFPIIKVYKTVKYKVDADEDWKRYKSYAKHVRFLRVSLPPGSDRKSVAAIKEIAYSRSQRCLLPNLYSLTVSDNFLASLLFVNDGLQHLSVRLQNEKDLMLLLQFILPKVTALTLLRIECGGAIPLQDVEEEFEKAFGALTFLRDLSIDKFDLTSKMFASIATLPNLKAFSYNSDPYTPAMRLQIESAGGEADEVSLGSTVLENITFKSHAKIFHQYFSLQLHHKSIQRLDVDITDDLTMLALKSFSRTLASMWEGLSDLRIVNGSGLVTDSRPFRSEALHLSDLHQLQRFTLHYPGPSVMTDDDMESLIKSWPKLIHFELKTKPNHKNPPGITLSSIKLFATYCKNLESLSICVDARPHSHLPQCTILLPTLKYLTFNNSPVKKSDVVALYLSQFCTSACNLVSDERDMENDEDSRMYRETWLRISRALRLILTALERERGRIA